MHLVPASREMISLVRVRVSVESVMVLVALVGDIPGLSEKSNVVELFC